MVHLNLMVKNCFIVTIKTLDDIFIEVTKGLDQESIFVKKHENQAAKYILNNKHIKRGF